MRNLLIPFKLKFKNNHNEEMINYYTINHLNINEDNKKRSECCIIQASTKGSQKLPSSYILWGILNLIKRCINYRRYFYYNALCELINTL